MFWNFIIGFCLLFLAILWLDCWINGINNLLYNFYISTEILLISEIRTQECSTINEFDNEMAESLRKALKTEVKKPQRETLEWVLNQNTGPYIPAIPFSIKKQYLMIIKYDYHQKDNFYLKIIDCQSQKEWESTIKIKASGRERKTTMSKRMAIEIEKNLLAVTLELNREGPKEVVDEKV